MPTGNDTLTVKKMKAEIAKKRQSKGTLVQPPEVVPQTTQQPVDNLYSQSDEIQPRDPKLTTSRGCTEHRTYSSQQVFKDLFIKRSLNVLHNQNEEMLIGYLTDLDFTAFGLTWNAKTSTLEQLIFDDEAAFKSHAAILVQMLGDRRHPVDGVFRVGGVCSRSRFMREAEQHDYGHGVRLRLHAARLMPVRQFIDETAIRSFWGLAPENDPVGSTESAETVTPNV